jgi:hypothetical protein
MRVDWFRVGNYRPQLVAWAVPAARYAAISRSRQAGQIPWLKRTAACFSK